MNQNNKKNKCPKGHPYSGVNSQGKRICKTCINERMRNRYKIPKNKSYQLNWQKKNKERVNKNSKTWRDKHPRYFFEWDENNPEKRKAIRERFAAKPERKDYQRLWQNKKYNENPEFKEQKKLWNRRYGRANPRSGSGYSFDERDSMNERRIWDKNTCQWFGCGLTSKQTSIHVHHIFPKQEYPDLSLITQYMICYCVFHHAEFHKARGDSYWKWISTKAGNYND